MQSDAGELARAGSFTGGVVVIPTRNRPDLAEAAMQSVLSQRRDDISILVSDNSTVAEDVKRLARHCIGLRDRGVRYVRPPEPLAMSPHWDWALQQALRTQASHFSVLSDRMLFKPGSLNTVLEVVEQHPDKILCYLHDKVLDFSAPFSVHQYEWTGKLFEVKASRLLLLSAQSVMYDGCCPRLLNCFVPRTVLDMIRRRFGSVCSSLAPDWSFGYRSLAIVDTILFLHQAALVHYALARSNGESAERGIMNQAYHDFVRILGQPVNACAPFPEIITAWNAIISEYCSVKREAQDSRFPELNMKRYIQTLARGVALIEDRQSKREMTAKLMSRGWHPSRRLGLRMPLRLIGDVSLLPPILLHRLTRFLWSRRRVFTTPEAALAYAANCPRPRSNRVAWEEAVHHGREVRIEPG